MANLVWQIRRKEIPGSPMDMGVVLHISPQRRSRQFGHQTKLDDQTASEDW